jgi:hypothetical protein
MSGQSLIRHQKVIHEGKLEVSMTDKETAGKKPDYLAYNVTENREGKGFFNKVGAAWEHRDGKGYDIQLDSVPVNGRVTLREMRENHMQEQSQVEPAATEQGKERSRGNER